MPPHKVKKKIVLTTGGHDVHEMLAEAFSVIRKQERNIM